MSCEAVSKLVQLVNFEGGSVIVTIDSTVLRLTPSGLEIIVRVGPKYQVVCARMCVCEHLSNW